MKTNIDIAQHKADNLITSDFHFVWHQEHDIQNEHLLYEDVEIHDFQDVNFEVW